MKNIGSLFYKPKRKESEKPKRWNIFSILGKAIKRTCTAIGALVLISTIISVILLSKFAGQAAPPLPKEMVLVYKIDRGVTEIKSRPSLLEPFPFDQPTIRNVIKTIERASEDDRVRALIVNLKNGGMSVAHIQELRDAIVGFRQSGKAAIIYSSSYDDPMNGLAQYYFASGFDEIWMQPVGMLSISGPDMAMPYAKNALEKIGVEPEFLQREKYKGAMENFAAAEMSESSREMWTSILSDLSTQMMRDVAQNREMSPLLVRKYVDQGILTGQEALTAKLIDRLDYADVLVSEMRKSLKGDPENKDLGLVSLAQYAQTKPKPVAKQNVVSEKNNVALIYAVGTIVEISGAQGNAGADKISGAITKAYEDENIDAIILRVDSPGGSPSASETIRRSLVKAKEKGKKVVVSMGPVAASGGYWVATDADKIVAMPGTITGSIGVVMGKFQARDLWDKIGLNWQGPQMGDNADIWSIHEPLDERGRARLNILIDDVYNSFLKRVAEGRGMSIEQAREVAQGRAWTGSQAQQNGLVDSLGGLNDAMDMTAELLGKSDRDDLNVMILPRELNAVEQFIEMFSPQVSIGKFLGLETALGQKIKAFITQADLNNNARHSSVYQAELELFR
jgi:protease-4